MLRDFSATSVGGQKGQAERSGRKVTPRTLLVAVGLVVALALFPGPVEGQDAQSPEELREERDRLKLEEAAKAAEIDATNAEIDELAAALNVLNDKAGSQQAEVDLATAAVAQAEAQLTEASIEVAAAEAEITALEQDLTAQAVLSFIGTSASKPFLASSGQPNQAIRMQAMVDQLTQSDVELAVELGQARDDLESQRKLVQQVADEAEGLRAAAEAKLVQLGADQAAQAALASAADDRLDHLLSEQGALQALGAEVSTKLLGNTENLAASLANSGSPASVPSTAVPATVSASEISDAGRGIYVHNSIVDQVKRLLADASAAGVELRGGGYRDPAAQIRTRRNNCGSSNYAIYEMPASKCSPPTARPGRSMHEKGLAIDFTYNGKIIPSRSGPAWNWLKANAANYGLKNLPSEPWHWSVNGN